MSRGTGNRSEQLAVGSREVKFVGGAHGLESGGGEASWPNYLH